MERGTHYTAMYMEHRGEEEEWGTTISSGNVGNVLSRGRKLTGTPERAMLIPNVEIREYSNSERRGKVGIP